MGILKGTLSFSRYHITGGKPENLTAWIDEQLKKYSFQDRFLAAEEKTMGWTGLENLLDTDFAYARYSWADYLMFALRIDKKTIPPTLLKIKTLEAEKKLLQQTGKKKLYREQKEGVKEGIRLELLEKMPPVPSFYEICWSFSKHSLIFTSLSDKIGQDLQDFFKRSFQLTLIPFVPWEQKISGAGDSTAQPNEDGSTDPSTIGREFLTWLWFKSEQRNGFITLPNVGEVEVNFLRRLVLESGDGEYAETVVCQGIHSDLKEGKEALRQGKKIREARIKLGIDTANWEFTFKADNFHIQSLQLPITADDADEGDDREGRILERIYLIEKSYVTMDQLFELFQRNSLSPDWSEEQARMGKWVQQLSAQ
jgi:hypothetical protein